MPRQSAWRFCDKCFGMFYNGDPDIRRRGLCPTDGGPHRSQGFVFDLPFDEPEMAGQPGWRFCYKCFGMFYNGDPDPHRKGRCPTGGVHEAFGFQFVLPHDAPETVGQPGWRFCHRCFGTFFNGDSDPRRKGSCPAGGAHEAYGFQFVLPHTGFPDPLSITLRAVVDDGRFIELNGRGFAPSQAVKVFYSLSARSDTNATTTGDVVFATDSSGGLSGRIGVTSTGLTGAAARAIDLYSGDWTEASI